MRDFHVILHVTNAMREYHLLIEARDPADATLVARRSIAQRIPMRSEDEQGFFTIEQSDNIEAIQVIA